MLSFFKNIFQINTESDEAIFNLEKIKREMEQELKRLEEIEYKIKIIKELRDRN